MKLLFLASLLLEKVVIRNLEGKIMLDQMILPKQPISTDNLSNGLYTITVGETTRKVVIQK